MSHNQNSSIARPQKISNEQLTQSLKSIFNNLDKSIRIKIDDQNKEYTFQSVELIIKKMLDYGNQLQNVAQGIAHIKGQDTVSSGDIIQAMQIVNEGYTNYLPEVDWNLVS